MVVDVLQHAGYSMERLRDEGGCAACVAVISAFPKHRKLVALGLQCLRRVMSADKALATSMLRERRPAMQVVR